MNKQNRKSARLTKNRREEAEKLFLESEKKYRRLYDFNKRILDNAPISIIVIDTEGKITSVNGYFYNFSGSSEDPIGKSIFDIDFFKREKLTDAYRDIFKTGKPFSRIDCREINKDGEIKFINIVAVPLKNLEGNIEGAISMATDNTEAHIARLKLLELNRELEKEIIEKRAANEKIRKISEKLEEKVKERTLELHRVNEQLTNTLDLKSRYVADSSHELRTPLTVIRGNLELADMEAKKRGSQAPELHSLILEEIGRMELVLSDLAMLAEEEIERKKIKYETVNLSEIAKSAERSLGVIARDRNIILKREGQSEGICVAGDYQRLEKLVLNIVHNAIKYTDPGGFIHIGIKKGDDEAIIFVKDSGIGIPEEDLPHIFERFYRVDKVRARGESGSGLGLSIVKRVVEDHAGTISVLSEPGLGSEFIVRLPLDGRTKIKNKSLFDKAGELFKNKQPDANNRFG